MIPDHMPEWAVTRYQESVSRATTKALKPWRHLFERDEVESFAWEIAVEVWRSWEAPHVRSPERYATTDLALKTMNQLAREARNLGWSRKEQPDGSFQWVSPDVTVHGSATISDYASTPAADTFIGAEPLSREELKEHLLVLARNYAHLNAEAGKLPEPVWEQFSVWVARYERQRTIRLARRTAEMALARYAYEVLRDVDTSDPWALILMRCREPGANVSQIARSAGVSRATLYRKLRESQGSEWREVA